MSTLSSATARETPAPPAGAAEAPSFEAAMERLEVIVQQMENARLPLEELIRSYEEGTRLIKICSERLSAAEHRIEIITRHAAGQPRSSEYPSPAKSGAAGGPAAPAAPKPAREPKTEPETSTPAASASRPSKTPNEVSLF